MDFPQTKLLSTIMNLRKDILVAIIGAVASVVCAFITARPVAQDTAERTVKGLLGVPIGSILASTLNPTDFATEMGANWVPADGRITKSEWEYWKVFHKSNVPDLRGVFLRGLNVFDSARPPRDDGFLDPEEHANSRLPGEPQMDEFKSHSHESSFGLRDGFAEDGGLRAPGRQTDMTLNLFHQGPISYGWKPQPAAEYSLHAEVSMPSGGKETRPKNVGVFWYIRVN